MLTYKDYANVFDLLNNLAPDFIQSALVAKVAPNTQEKKDYEMKAAYIRVMFETIKTMNGVRLNNEPQQSPNNYRDTTFPSKPY